jgi:hypothetical protein
MEGTGMDALPVMDEDREVTKTHTEELPGSLEELVERFKSVITLPNVEEVRVTPTQFQVKRRVRSSSEVLPDPEEHKQIDPAYVIDQVELVDDGRHPEEHPWFHMRTAFDLIRGRGFTPSFLVAPSGGYVEAYFGFPEEPPKDTAMGLPILRTDNETCQHKLVVLGGTTTFLTDAKLGVVIDLGA